MARTAKLDELLTGLESGVRSRRRADAARLHLLAGVLDLAIAEGEGNSHGIDIAVRAAESEVALALGVARSTARRQMGFAWSLEHRHAGVLQAMREGRIGEAHAREIHDAAELIVNTVVHEEQAGVLATYTEACLEMAVHMSSVGLRQVARRLAAETAGNAALEVEHAQAVEDRRCWVREIGNGMAEVGATLPTVAAFEAYDRVRRIAKKQAEHAAGGAGMREGTTLAMDAGDGQIADTRTADQRRADVFTDLLLSGGPDSIVTTGRRCVSAHVQVVVAETTLTARSLAGEPAAGGVCEVVGIGPVAQSVACDLLEQADPALSEWDQITVDESGGVLSVDRYRPSAAFRRFVEARDLHCRFPGCRVAAVRCDLDHIIDAQFGGETSTENLAVLCRGHHTMKHHTGWQYRHVSDRQGSSVSGEGASVSGRSSGVLEWTSPTGRIYREPPPSRSRYLQDWHPSDGRARTLQPVTPSTPMSAHNDVPDIDKLVNESCNDLPNTFEPAPIPRADDPIHQIIAAYGCAELDEANRGTSLSSDAVQ